VSTVKYWFRKEQREVQVDILANNPGIGITEKCRGGIREGDLGKVFDRHIRGTLLMAQDMLPLMKEGGRIVSISTPTVVAGAAGKGLSSSSKAAVEILTKCRAEELGRKKICVNRVSSKETEKRGCNLEEAEVELVGVVAWLVGEESRLVSGQNVTIGGGWGVI
jgi:NAD(P)-dependent dehydrogenase (short-subunit alcohol dehydrogenase family)